MFFIIILRIFFYRARLIFQNTSVFKQKNRSGLFLFYTSFRFAIEKTQNK